MCRVLWHADPSSLLDEDVTVNADLSRRELAQRLSRDAFIRLEGRTLGPLARENSVRGVSVLITSAGKLGNSHHPTRSDIVRT